MENTEDVGDVWHRMTARRIGEAVAARRKELGLTAQQLAERCRELGAPIHRTTITKIENGRPRFDLGELILLAAALSTSPVVLVYPGPYDTETNVLPRQLAMEFDAAQWFSGRGYYRPIDADEPDVEENQAAEREWSAGVSSLTSARSLAYAAQEKAAQTRTREIVAREREENEKVAKVLKDLERQAEVASKLLDEIDRRTRGSGQPDA